MVQEYLNIFPEYIPEFSPKIEVKFFYGFSSGTGTYIYSSLQNVPVEAGWAKKAVKGIAVEKVYATQHVYIGSPVLFVKKKDGSM